MIEKPIKFINKELINASPQYTLWVSIIPTLYPKKNAYIPDNAYKIQQAMLII